MYDSGSSASEASLDRQRTGRPYKVLWTFSGKIQRAIPFAQVQATIWMPVPRPTRAAVSRTLPLTSPCLDPALKATEPWTPQYVPSVAISGCFFRHPRCMRGTPAIVCEGSGFSPERAAITTRVPAYPTHSHCSFNNCYAVALLQIQKLSRRLRFDRNHSC
ncbi:hypothetical protein BD311DRAFT_760389 [Dichomitus squalens]|uniref:Uncharacterized protein n=1 Tax=Dichomitus squalens TaxID=114155 RepID=A0A4Q9MKC7_9APHY|nr:hypothetical protein BD311DRAFT_760389 [Dichomitus squalens]